MPCRVPRGRRAASTTWASSRGSPLLLTKPPRSSSPPRPSRRGESKARGRKLDVLGADGEAVGVDDVQICDLRTLGNFGVHRVRYGVDVRGCGLPLPLLPGAAIAREIELGFRRRTGGFVARGERAVLELGRGDFRQR